MKANTDKCRLPACYMESFHAHSAQNCFLQRATKLAFGTPPSSAATGSLCLSHTLLAILGTLLLWTTSTIAEPVKVGMLVPLSGPVSFMGQDMRDGFMLCSEDKTHTVIEDHQSNAATAVSAFQKLVNSDKINFGIITFSNVAEAIIPIAKSRDIPLVLSIVSARRVAQSGGSQVVNFFTTGEQDGAIMGEYASTKAAFKTAAVIYLEGEYGRSYDTAFTQAFESHGGKVLAHENYLGTTTDFKSQLTRIKALNVDILYLIGYDSHSLNILRQSKELGTRYTMAGNWTMASPQFRKGNESLFENVLCTAPSFYLQQTQSAAAFQNQFNNSYSRQPSAYAAIGCDIAGIINKNSDKTPKQLIEEIRTLKDYHGIIGDLTASATGELEIALSPAQIQNGVISIAAK